MRHGAKKRLVASVAVLSCSGRRTAGARLIIDTRSETSIAARAAYWARLLTSIPSVTGTADEAAFADRLADHLRATSAFGKAPAVLEMLDVPGGLYPRKVLLLLVRGKGAETLILTGHFDTVEIESYGALRPLALDPDRLLPALIKALEDEPPSVANERALADLRSGDFLPGRGLLDMKAGLAAALAALEQFATDPRQTGNLLFVAVPDEEANSAGARLAAPALAGFAQRHGLCLRGTINIDAIADDGDGRLGRTIAMGTVGKLLPTALVVGKPVHASYAFRGMSAAALAGALAAEMEWLPALTETLAGETTAGPTLLGMKDTRQGYDVTMPERVWMYWNVALLQRTAAGVLEEVADAARRSSAALIEQLEARRANAAAEGKRLDVAVLTYAELFSTVSAALPSIGADLTRIAVELAAAGTTLPEQSRALTERLWDASGLAGPAIIIGFGSTPYLPVLLGDSGAHAPFRRALLAAADAVSTRTGTGVTSRRFFPAISDVSFFGDTAPSGLDSIAANTPMWEAGFAGDGGPMTAGLPSVNIGPWGRDYHSRVERLDVHYAFDVLPVLLLEVARQLFDQREG